MRIRLARTTTIVICMVLAAAASAPTAAQTVLYVHATATGAADGSSWIDAYTDLQDALDHAATIPLPEPVEIWVAAGVYKPDRGTGSRSMSFELIDGVAIYGGFAGWEACRDERDIDANPTILSGDLLGNDQPENYSASNCCQFGAPYACDDAECRARVALLYYAPCAMNWESHCAFAARSICCSLCRTSRCDNTYNVVFASGVDSTAILDGVRISAGEADGLDTFVVRRVYGGGAYLEASSPVFSQCTFARNVAASAGAGMYADGGGPTILQCVFVENEDLGGGRPALTTFASDPLISGSLFRGNIGGGVLIDDRGRQPITDCRFIDNVGGGRGLEISGNHVVRNCDFVGNLPGGMRSKGIVSVVDCRFIGNQARSYGGGVDNWGVMTLRNCLFTGNRAGLDGFAGAHAAFVGSLGSSSFFNCTVVNNQSGIGANTPRLTNSIVWGNGSPFQHVQISSSNPPIINHSIIHGWGGSWGGVGNSGADPMFVDPLGPDGIAGTEDDDYRLAPDSPAINAGDPAYNPVSGPADLDGVPRILCGRVDIGAYEFGLGDFNCDRTADLTDFAFFPACQTGPTDAPLAPGCEAFDANADQRIDLADFARLQRFLTAP